MRGKRNGQEQVKLNRLGKMISDLGYSSLSQFHKETGCKVRKSTLYSWCVNSRTPNDGNALGIDSLAHILNTTRNDVLDMIASKPEFECTFQTKSPIESTLKQLRINANLSTQDVADMLGITRQKAYDIERGQVRKFDSIAQKKDYADLLGISVDKLDELQDKACHENLIKDYSRRPDRYKGDKPVEKRIPRNLFQEKRYALGLSGRELAEKIGVNAQWIIDLENGRRLNLPDTDIAKKYCDILDISLGEFQRTLKEVYNKNYRCERTAPSDTDDRDEIVSMIKESDKSNVEIAEELGISESTVRHISAPVDTDVCPVTVKEIVDDMQTEEYKERVDKAVKEADKLVPIAFGAPKVDTDVKNVVISQKTAKKILNAFYGKVTSEAYISLVAEMTKGGLLL